jgi:formiminotetrahydrofolate cyclodeaminase
VGRGRSESKAPDCSYLDQRLGDFLDLVAAHEPAPGGGAVTAITAALAAGLVAMAARYSAGEMADADRLAYDAERLRHRAAGLADDDAEAYGAVIAAYQAVRRSGSSDRQEVHRALRRATEVPLEVVDIAAETARLAAVLTAGGKRDIRGDAAAALVLAEAATRSAAQLVAINVKAYGGDEELSRRAEAGATAARHAVALHPNLR